MKKLVVVFLVLAMAAIVHAGTNTNFVLLNQIRATGAGSTFDVRYAHQTWGCDVITFGNMSSGVVRIEGNQGGTAFDPAGMATHTLTSAQLTAGIGSFVITSHAVKKIRANIVSLSGGTDPRLSVQCTGGD